MIINNLHKKFGKKVIFNGENFEFENGKITYVMGESGKGKTTLLRIISDLDKDYSAQIIDKPTRLAYVFQEPRLFPTLTAIENIKIVNEASTNDPKYFLNLLELNGCEDMLPSELSGGMKMRLSIARALYYDADIILMDEPFSALDEDMKKRLAPLIFELLKGKTVIIVSHDISDAQSYANKIVKL